MGFGLESMEWMVIVLVFFILTVMTILVAEIIVLNARLRGLSTSLEANLILIDNNFKRLQINFTELLLEQKRVSRLTLEQIDLKKAELTGEFEIIEEPIPGASQEMPKSRETIDLG